jgi:hypothetical protein
MENLDDTPGGDGERWQPATQRLLRRLGRLITGREGDVAMRSAASKERSTVSEKFDSFLIRSPDEPYARYEVDAPAPLPVGAEKLTPEVINAVVDHAKELESDEPEPGD